MAGHSKWSNIKRRKGAVDAKRGKLFTKIIREIQTSARIGGGDPTSNPRLRDAITEAKGNNMPKDNIERAIRRGTGQEAGSSFEEITYEGYGPEGVAMLIESLTDNRNRTVAELRALMTRNGGNLGEQGSVAWVFEKKGLIHLKKDAAPEEKLMDLVIEAGAEDLSGQTEGWEVVTEPTTFGVVKAAIESQGISIETAALTAVPKNTVKLSGESAEKMVKLMELVEDMDDVQKVYANFDIDDDELERLTG